MKQLGVIAVIVVCAALVLNVISGSAPSATRGGATEVRALPVETVLIEPRDISVRFQSFGNVEPAETYRIHSLVSGQVLRKSSVFKDGTRVQKDTVLLELDESQFRLAVANAQSEVAAATLALADEQARADQAASDWSKRSPTNQAKDYVLRKPHLVAARARLESAKTALSVAQQDLARTKLRAGFDGLIRDVNIAQGAFVNTTQELGSGFSDGYAEVRLPLNAADLALLRGAMTDATKMNVSIVLENTLTRPSENWLGQFVRLESTINQQSQQVSLVARVERPFDSIEKTPLLPGQYVRAQIEGQVLSNVISVASALVYQDRFVYVVEGENRDRLVQRPVEMLHRADDIVVIKDGLEQGDELVTTVLGNLPSGTKIKVTQ